MTFCTCFGTKKTLSPQVLKACPHLSLWQSVAIEGWTFRLTSFNVIEFFHLLMHQQYMKQTEAFVWSVVSSHLFWISLNEKNFLKMFLFLSMC